MPSPHPIPRPTRSCPAPRLLAEPLEPRLLCSAALYAPPILAGRGITLDYDTARFLPDSRGVTNPVSVKRWDGASWIILASLPANANTFTDFTTAPGTNYYYSLTAFNAAGETWADHYLTVNDT